ncbi:hypothetical protein PP175_03905 [Aneurinibacillus sp. Ricciae_BoGa-3]|uniref:hypothetical protein n=1 Tax=Aneurinibacillus sp. Ricciae_BoGa-3 TaxID=3022697 RepID=UPI0023412BDF|nr:hypothetical protein [Aneurinibacillus sp. Ricciae_BoGa-3]WCK55141.1 hypothetical protein PP175_03905 [Aneurinibacillus sp. Ricciae_BoGa-3]
MNLHEILNSLSYERPVFYSEADFQHALAWEIHKKHPQYQLRLEYNPHVFQGRTHIDIWVRTDEGINIAIELKYKTKKTSITYNNEIFNLQKHGAPANNRFLVVGDLQRIEHTVRECEQTIGYVIMLTNDNGYWREWKEGETKDRDFRIQHGRLLTGVLRWKEDTAPSTINKHGESLTISGRYHLGWKDYSNLSNVNHGLFKYLLIEVNNL